MKTVKRKPASKSAKRKWITAFLLLLPLFSILIVFKYYSFFYSLYMSLFDWSGMGTTNYIGLENYKTMFSDDTFWVSMVNLAKVTLFNCLKMLVMSFLAAELVLNIKNRFFQTRFKYIFIIPIVIPNMVNTLLWQWIYDSNGLLNTILEFLGFSEIIQPWLATDNALWAILMIGIPWIAGIPFLVMLSGLQNINESLFETAQLDGCSYLKRLWSIDLPLLIGQVKYILITTIIASMQFFEPIQVLTNGGPGVATMTPAMYMYQQAFSYYKFGYSSAIGTFIFVIVMAVTLVNLKVLNQDVSID